MDHGDGGDEARRDLTEGTSFGGWALTAASWCWEWEPREEVGRGGVVAAFGLEML